MDNCIEPDQINIFVFELKNFDVIDIGSDMWIKVHKNLLRLGQQAVIEAFECREEVVKELMIENEKLIILIYEAYSILVWRTKILPILFDIGCPSNTTFILYTILYHEAAAISLLEMCLFHENGCLSIGDHAIDLIDYCAYAVTQLIGIVHSDYLKVPLSTKSLVNESPIVELQRQCKDLQYKTGIRCLTILSYLTDKIECLSLSVVRQMVHIHDIPCILSEILHCQPWQRNNNGIEKFIDDKWIKVNGDDVLKITKCEAQTWFCLRNLLFSKNAMNMYAINEFRQRELSKCQLYLCENILDQLPPLIDLKHCLCTLGLSGGGNGKMRIILEEITFIKDVIVENAKRIGYQEIAHKHAEKFFNLNDDSVQLWAQKLNNIYNLEIFE